VDGALISGISPDKGVINKCIVTLRAAHPDAGIFFDGISPELVPQLPGVYALGALADPSGASAVKPYVRLSIDDITGRDPAELSRLLTEAGPEQLEVDLVGKSGGQIQLRGVLGGRALDVPAFLTVLSRIMTRTEQGWYSAGYSRGIDVILPAALLEAGPSTGSHTFTLFTPGGTESIEGSGISLLQNIVERMTTAPDADNVFRVYTDRLSSAEIAATVQSMHETLTAAGADESGSADIHRALDTIGKHLILASPGNERRVALKELFGFLDALNDRRREYNLKKASQHGINLNTLKRVISAA
jgi:hypothetical protein